MLCGTRSRRRWPPPLSRIYTCGLKAGWHLDLLPVLRRSAGPRPDPSALELVRCVLDSRWGGAQAATCPDESGKVPGCGRAGDGWSSRRAAPRRGAARHSRMRPPADAATGSPRRWFPPRGFWWRPTPIRPTSSGLEIRRVLRAHPSRLLPALRPEARGAPRAHHQGHALRQR